MIAPYTGTYQFWISGDAATELHFNSAGTTSPLTLIASNSSATSYQTWTTYSSQQSTTFNLTAGQICYLEARHKESTSTDHLSVAWQIKDTTNTTTIVPREIIPGRYLSPHDLVYSSTNAVAASTSLLYEIWDGLSGSNLSTLTSSPNFPNKPDRAIDIPGFTTSYIPAGDQYGACIRAYLTPRTTGTYYFSISGDDATALLLSTDSNPANATQIASTTSATAYETWNTYASQTSAGISLTANTRYYIEARVKENTGNDHLSVSWTGPNITSNEILPYSTNNVADSTIAPYDSNIAPAFGASSYSFTVASNYTLNSSIGSVSSIDAAFDPVRYQITSGNTAGRFAINPSTGAIRVVSSLNAGAFYQLQITAQDSGHGGRFTPKSNTVPVTIQAPGINSPPQIVTNPLTLGTFPAGNPLSASITSATTDPNTEDTLTYSLISGPSWLTLNASGTLSGTPNYTQFGPWSLTYQVTDGVNPPVQGSLTLTIGNPPNSPATTLTTLNTTAANATSGSVVSGSATNASSSDNSYLGLRESNGSPSILEYRWTFSTPNNTPVTLNLEGYQTATVDNDNFQFAVSTDGGVTYTNAILISNTSDTNTLRTFNFTTGSTGSTIIRVLDTNRSGASNRDTLFIDLLSLSLPGNTTPTLTDTSFNVTASAPIGTVIGTLSANNPDSNQTLTWSIPRGNETGLFAINNSGQITVNASIPASSGPYSLIAVATDDGSPSRAGYATITINVITPSPATITLGNLTTTYDGSTKVVTATTSPSGLSVSITYDGSSTPPTQAGSYAIVATIDSPNYQGSTTGTLTIQKATASIALSNLNQTYDGTPKSATITTSPTGLNTVATYSSSTTPPTAIGTYALSVTINDLNYSGSTTGNFIITQADLILTSGQTLKLGTTGGSYQNLNNAGTLLLGSGTLSISGNATNSGTLILTDLANLQISGTFTNTGVIDIINWNGTLPAGLINSGTILDRSSIRVLNSSLSGNTFQLTVPNYVGHQYQLQTTSLLQGSWTNLGTPTLGSGFVSPPTTLQFQEVLPSPPAAGSKRFYRIVVTPAP